MTKWIALATAGIAFLGFFLMALEIAPHLPGAIQGNSNDSSAIAGSVIVDSTQDNIVESITKKNPEAGILVGSAMTAPQAIPPAVSLLDWSIQVFTVVINLIVMLVTYLALPLIVGYIILAILGII